MICGFIGFAIAAWLHVTAMEWEYLRILIAARWQVMEWCAM